MPVRDAVRLGRAPLFPVGFSPKIRSGSSCLLPVGLVRVVGHVGAPFGFASQDVLVVDLSVLLETLRCVRPFSRRMSALRVALVHLPRRSLLSLCGVAPFKLGQRCSVARKKGSSSYRYALVSSWSGLAGASAAIAAKVSRTLARKARLPVR